MRILWNDIAKTASLTVTNSSINYPVSNIIHPYLKKRFQANDTTSLITFSWDNDVSVNSVYFGHHNLSQLILRVKDSGGSIIYTDTIASPSDNGRIYFDKIDNVRSIELDCTALSTLKIGGVGIGVYYQNIDFLNNPNESARLTWGVEKSDAGQTNTRYIKPLRTYAFSFRDRLTADKKVWLENIDTYGPGPHWFDITEDNIEFLPVLYATITAYPGVVRNGRRYDNSLQIEEAR